MKLFHFYHAHHHRRKHHWFTNFRYFELSVWLHVLGGSLVSVFIPILLLQNGYELREVLWYFVAFYGIDVPLNWVADRLIRRFGAVEITIAGIGAFSIFLVILALAPPLHWGVLLVMAILLALYDTFYWVGHMYLFAQSEDKHGDASMDTGMIEIVRRLGGMAGPIVGGALLIFGHEGVLFAGAIALLLLSAAPLFRLRNIADRPRTKPLPLRAFFRDRKDRFNFSAMLLSSLHWVAESDLWPIFIFLAFGSIESVALLAGIIAVANLLFSYITGKLSRYHAAALIGLGSFCIFVVWVFRLGAGMPAFHDADFVAPLYYVSVVLVGFFSLFISIPLEGSFLARSKEMETLSTMAYRNAASMAAPFVLYLLLAILVDVFKVGFATAALAMLILVLAAGIFARGSHGGVARVAKR